MKRFLSLLVLLSAVTTVCAEVPATEWRRLAFLPAIKPGARVSCPRPSPTRTSTATS